MNDEFKTLFYKKLDLQYLSLETQQHFLDVMECYIKHGRTYEYIASRLDRLLFFFAAIGIGNVEVSIILTNFPSILNIVDELYSKYLFLAVIENDDNSFRRHKFFSKTKDYRVSLEKMYARYRLCMEAGYEDIKWNTLVHASDNEFAKIFVEGTYIKSYQIFQTVEQVNEWLSNVDINDLNIDEYKVLPVNEEIVEKYEGKRRIY